MMKLELESFVWKLPKILLFRGEKKIGGAYWELIDVSRRRLISHSLSVSQFFKRTEYHYVANVYVYVAVILLISSPFWESF